MTNETPKMPAEATADRTQVDRTTFEKEAIWLPMLAVQHWNAGVMSIEGKTFTDCLIEGPGLIAVMTGTVFDNCAMGTTSDVRNLLFKPVGGKMSGVIGMGNCRFVRCRFVQVGFTGSDELVDQLAEGIKTLSDANPSVGPAA